MGAARHGGENPRRSAGQERATTAHAKRKGMLGTRIDQYILGISWEYYILGIFGAIPGTYVYILVGYTGLPKPGTYDMAPGPKKGLFLT